MRRDPPQSKYDPRQISLTAKSSFRYLFALVILVLGCATVWRFAIYRSNVDLGLAELERSIAGSRPVESRIAGFSYSPWTATRGAPSQFDPESRFRAEQLLSVAAGVDYDAVSLAAYGKYYLTDRKFEKAIELFERAAIAGNKSAAMDVDLGVAYLEFARETRAAGNRAKMVELLDKSLGQFETALKLSPKMPDALFDRALCLDLLLLKEQTKSAWKDYLTVDADSHWSDEARNNLARLEAADSADISSGELIERFTSAASSADSSAARELISNTRELITQKYLPQSLAMAVTQAPAESRAALLNALKYAGDLELKHINDPFASEIARFYKERNAVELDRLRIAHASIKEGYRLTLDLQYGAAKVEFENAKAAFDAEGDSWESLLAEYFIGYCLATLGKPEESFPFVSYVADQAHTKQYRWLEMTASYWVAGSYRSQKRIAESTLFNKKALAIAEEIDDKYGIQRNLMDQSANYLFVRQNVRALDLTRRVLEVSDASTWSLRQRFRNDIIVSTIWSSIGLKNAARYCALESVALSDRIGDLMFRTNARSVAGNIVMQSGDGSAAKVFLDESTEIAQTIVDEKSRTLIVAQRNLQTGDALESIGDIAEATNKYRIADELFRQTPMPFDQYRARLGVLRGLKKMGLTVELDEQLPLALADIEEFRDKIIEENERSSFFANGVTIYDIALERKFDQGDPGAALNLSEFSTTRSLIDRLTSLKNSGPVEPTGSKPMMVDQIRTAMPENVQIVKYTVLENRLLIWLISKSKFIVVPVDIKMPELRERTESYVRLVRSGLPGDSDRIKAAGVELYKTLIDPIYGELDPTLDICIVPNKFLFYIPFAALPTTEGEPLISRYNLEYAASATAFVLSSAIAANKPGEKNEKLLAVGNPKFNKADFVDLPDLPEAEDEVIEIGRNYQSPNIFTTTKATKQSFTNSLTTADIVHFAGHYVVVDRDPALSYLMFSANDLDPGSSFLTNGEINKLKLPRTKMVVLAACRSGLDDYFDGEGIVGLTRTFLAVGVPVVIASQWSVDSGAAAELMEKFHAHRRVDGMNTSRALRAAQLDLANEPNGRFNSPFYWAAFAVFGGYSKY